MSHTHGVDSEVGRLRTVVAHRPGTELGRVTPRTGAALLFEGLPWLARAQQEHDLLTQRLRDSGVDVLYVAELLQDCLEYPAARQEAIAAVTRDPRLGDQLRADLGTHLHGLDPETLAQVLIGGLTPAEFRGRGVVYGLLGRHDFVVPPLPHLVFTRDSSVWVGHSVAVAALTGWARIRECALMQTIYRRHPRFASAGVLPVEREPLHGGDVLQLAPGVVAAGVGGQTSAAAVERLAARLAAAGLAHTVLAVPLSSLPAGTQLDTVCTLIDRTTVLMSPALAYTLQVHTVTSGEDGPRVSRPQPFLEAVALAIGAGPLTLVSTGTEPASSRRQWDDGGNALALAPGLVMSHERNVATNERLEAAGWQVVRVPGNELRSTRGGPRAMACALSRDPAAATEEPAVAAPGTPAAVLTSPSLPGLDTTPASPMLPDLVNAGLTSRHAGAA